MKDLHKKPITREEEAKAIAEKLKKSLPGYRVRLMKGRKVEREF